MFAFLVHYDINKLKRAYIQADLNPGAITPWTDNLISWNRLSSSEQWVN